MGNFYYTIITLNYYSQEIENQYFKGRCNKLTAFFPINLFYMR